jgi:hypothetical protein
LLRLRDLGDTEVGGFGISAADDLLLIEDVRLIRQWCCPVTVKFDDEAVADFFDAQVDRGLAPERFARIWIHTHPGHSPHPSSTDEETFARCFDSADWAMMFILARGGQTYARLKFRAGPGGALVLPVEVDFQQPFAAAAWAEWDAEYAQAVITEPEKPAAGIRLRGNARKKENPGPALDERWITPPPEESPRHGPFDDFFPDPYADTDHEYFGAPF